jgi:hypothetical protein
MGYSDEFRPARRLQIADERAGFFLSEDSISEIGAACATTFHPCGIHIPQIY